METKQLLLALTLMIFMLSISNCNTANEEQLTTMPSVTREGTSWTLEAFIEGQATGSPIDDTEITPQFDGGYVKGFAGCNDYGGAYALERGALSIAQIDITEQFCLEPPGIMAQETKYMEILQEVTAFIRAKCESRAVSGEDDQVPSDQDMVQGKCRNSPEKAGTFFYHCPAVAHAANPSTISDGNLPATNSRSTD